MLLSNKCHQVIIRKMSELSFRPLLELNFAEMADLFNRCFEDYVISFNVTAQSAAASPQYGCVQQAFAQSPGV